MIRADIHLIERIAAMLAPYADDADAFWTTLDGETDALDMIDRHLAAAQSDAALAEAIKAQEADLKARRDRIEMRGKAHRDVIRTIMQASGQRKLERPRGTLSLSAARLSLSITDEAAIPTQLCKTVTSPDRAAIKAQLEAGETVPGAELVRGDETLTVRVK